MANVLVTPTIIANEAIMQLENNLVMGQNVHLDYKKEFVKIGQSVSIRKPVKFEAISGTTRQHQDVQEGTFSLSIDQHFHTSWGFSAVDLTLTVEQYNERYISPATIVLANKVDLSLAGLSSSLWASGGTPGTTPNTFAALGNQAALMDDMAVPDDGRRKLVLNPRSRWAMADGLKGIFDAAMAKDMIRKGLLGKLANFELYGDQNIRRHTNGVHGGTPLVDAPVATSNSTPQATSQTLHIDGATASQANWAKAGDVFTIADVYDVNPVSKETTGSLKQFVVVDTVTSGAGAGDTDLTISPAIVTSGPYQNVSAIHVDGAAITFVGSPSVVYPQNLAYHRNALALVFVPLELPDSVNFKARTQHEGYSLTVVKDYDIDNYEEVIRVDERFGVKAIYPDTGTRLWG